MKFFFAYCIYSDFNVYRQERRHESSKIRQAMNCSKIFADPRVTSRLFLHKYQDGNRENIRRSNKYQECCSESENIFLPLQRRSNLASKYGSVFTRSSSENLTVFFRIRGFGQHSFSFVYQAVAVSCSSVCTFIRRLCTYRCGVRSFILIRVLSEPSDE